MAPQNLGASRMKTKPDVTATQELLMSVIESRQMYGIQISDTIKAATKGKKIIPVGSLYPILKRLEARGFLKSEWGEATEEREGARRKYYSLTGAGHSALAETRSIRQAVNAYTQPAGGI